MAVRLVQLGNSSIELKIEYLHKWQQSKHKISNVSLYVAERHLICLQAQFVQYIVKIVSGEYGVDRVMRMVSQSPLERERDKDRERRL